jgi:hypothetical protein
MRELRKLARWQVNQPAFLKLDQADEKILCRVKDINFKGARVALDAKNIKLSSDSTFKVSLWLSEDYTVEATIWVVWTRVIDGVNHCGLYFSKIKDVDKDKIYKFIHKFRSDGLKKESWLGSFEDEKTGEGGEMGDHRIFERFKKEFSARFIGLDGKEKQSQTFDISAKGLGLLTADEVQPHAPLEIWLNVPNSTDPLYTRGQVVWSKPEGSNGYRLGVELERANFMSMSRLLRA